MEKRFYISPVSFFDPEGGDDKTWRPESDVHLFSEPGISHGIFETDGVTATVALVKVETDNHTPWQNDPDLDPLGGANLDARLTAQERGALNGKANKHADVRSNPARDGDSMRDVLAKIAQDIRATSGKSFAQPEWF